MAEGTSPSVKGTRPSVIRSPGVPPLMTVVLCCFSGFALLLPVSPQWALDGGADEFGAGLVTAVLMAMTVASQLCVKATLRKLGWSRTFALGALLLGLPAPLQALSDNLWPILATTALRGAGFGIMTVCGATAVAALAPRGRQGAAIGVYGLSIALPQVVLTPAAPALVAAFALPAILACGILPVLAIPFTPALGRALDTHADAPAPDSPAPGSSAPGPSSPPTATAATLRRILMPVILLLLVTVAGGAILTFTPQFAGTPGAAAGALITFTATAAVTRWGCGVAADRISTRPLNFGLLLAACAASSSSPGPSVPILPYSPPCWPDSCCWGLRTEGCKVSPSCRRSTARARSTDTPPPSPGTSASTRAPAWARSCWASPPKWPRSPPASS